MMLERQLREKEQRRLQQQQDLDEHNKIMEQRRQ